MKTKAEIRGEFLQKRKNLGKLERQRLSQQVAERTIQYIEENQWITRIHIFLPIEKLNEINTWLIIKVLLQQQKLVYTAVTDLEKEVMRTASIDEQSEFVEDKYGLPVPINPFFMPDGYQYDLVIVPLLAFDLKGVRVGYGKGYYDRFFEAMKRDVRKIGLSYFPATDLLPRENHDVLLDGCILPDQTLHFTK